MGNHDTRAEALSALRQAAQQFKKVKESFDKARPYAKLSPKCGGQTYIDAATALHASRGQLRTATVRAVQSGVSQVEASRISGISRAQVSRLSRGATSGKDVLPPVVYLVDTLPAGRIAERYRGGESMVELGEAYGCGSYTIRYLLKRMGVPRRVGNSVELAVSNEELARRYLVDRAMLKDMAAEFGVSVETISRRLEDAGVHVPVGQRRMDLPDAEIVRRFRSGESINALARSYGVSSPAIVKRLRENGAKRPSTAWSARTAAAQRDAALALYQSGLSDAAVAKEIGISRTTVRKVVAEAGVKRATPEELAVAHLRSPVMQEIVRRRRAGEPIRSLAQEYGIPRSTLARRLAHAQDRS